MSVSSQKGEARLSTFIWLVFFAALVYAGWNVVPVYIDNFALKDKMNEIARAPKWSNPDDKIVDNLMRYVRENRLDGYIQRPQIKVSTLETSRRISLAYQRTANILPGFPHTFQFSHQVDQPLVY